MYNDDIIDIAFHRLLNYEGSLMAFAGKSDKKENVTAAIAANIWMSHERGGHTALPDETLNFIVLDCLVSLTYCMILPDVSHHIAGNFRGREFHDFIATTKVSP